ncbi:MAG: hypothetical protein ISR96_02120 [Nitrospira sp.]|nr:hypothetical protein [bacterium]MBL7048313.1 hypothetical protein [Nitrospira sp.]
MRLNYYRKYRAACFLVSGIIIVSLFHINAYAEESDPGRALMEKLPTLMNTMNDHYGELEKYMRKQGANDDTRAPITDTHKPYNREVRDPFTVTPEMETAIAYGSAPLFRAAPETVRIPKLTLRGITYKDTPDDSIALLEVAGSGVYMVRAGDQISISPAGPEEVIKIQKMDRLSIVVEVGTLGGMIIVR